MQSLAWANERLGLNARATVFTRSSVSFPRGAFRFVIHAAPESPGDVNVLLTRRVLAFAEENRSERILYTSSGAVYKHETEYAQLKRASEAVLNGSAVIARLFAFIGPYLKLDANFAAGNFIRDVLNEQAITVQSDGTPIRTYLYAADLAVWLWTLLVEGTGVYDVGGETPISIAELAYKLSELTTPATGVKILGRSSAGDDYVPDTRRARTELGLQAWTPLEEAIRRTYDWHRDRRA